MIGLDSIVCQAFLCDQIAKIKRSCGDELLGERARRSDQVMCRRGSEKRGLNAWSERLNSRCPVS